MSSFNRAMSRLRTYHPINWIDDALSRTSESCNRVFPQYTKLTTLTSNLNSSKYLKNEKEVIFSEHPYVLYTKDIIFPPNSLVYIFSLGFWEKMTLFSFLEYFWCIWNRCQCCQLCVLWENSNRVDVLNSQAAFVFISLRFSWYVWTFSEGLSCNFASDICTVCMRRIRWSC